MKIRFMITAWLFLASLGTHAQNDYSYEGIIKLSDISLYTYKISFNEKDGVLNGYSITDFEGEYETKSLITGTVDYKTRKITLYESDILTAKSPVAKDKFCYIYFDGSFDTENGKQLVEGKFNSLYKDGESCIFGWIDLVGTGDILKKKKKKKFRKIRRRGEEEEIVIDPIVDVTNSINLLKNDDILHIFTGDSQITIYLYDEDHEDEDRIDFSIDGKLYLENQIATTTPEKIVLDIDKDKVVVNIKALTNGIIGKNTIRMDITDSKYQTRILTDFTAGDSGTLVFVKR